MTKPKINPPLTTFDFIIEAIGAICLIYMIVQLIATYPGLDDRIAIHFNASGQPDGWGNKSSMLILPVVTIVMYAGLTTINQFPYLFNYPFEITEKNVVRQYQLAKSLIIVLKAGVTGLFAYIQLQTINVSSGHASGLGAIFIFLVLILTFLPIISYFVLASRSK